MTKSKRIEVGGVLYTQRAYEELSGYKTCSKCKIRHPLSRYGLRANSVDGNTKYKASCKSCQSLIVLEAYYSNRAKKIDYQKKLNKQRIKEYRHRKSAQASKERAIKKNATPLWFSLDDAKQIRDIFKQREQLTKQTGIDHHVDHIIPLNGTTVCGLHVPWNLRIIPAIENLSKAATIDNSLLSELYTGFEPTEVTPELYYLLSQHDDKLKFKQT